MPTAPLLLLAVLTASGGAGASGPPDGGAPGALEALGSALAAQVHAARPEPPVGVFAQGPDAALARLARAHLLEALAARGVPATAVDAPSADAAPAAARAQDARSVVTLTVALEGPRLSATGALASTWVNFWAGRRGESPRTLAPLSAQADARALPPAGPPTPAVAPLALELAVLARLPRVPVALACRDVDGDARPELAALLPDAVLLLGPDGRALARHALDGAPAAPAPAREPFGGVSLLPAPPRLAWLSSGHQRGEVLAVEKGSLRVLAPAAALELDGAAATLAAGLNAFAADGPGRPGPFQLHARRGDLELWAFADGTLGLGRGDSAPLRLAGAGTAAALADLDGDGAPELVLTSARYFPDGDAVTVVSAAAALALPGERPQAAAAPALWKGLTPRGRALSAAACDLDGDGADEVLLGGWLQDGGGEVHVLRRVRP